MTMTLIQTVTVGAGGASNITFSSVPQTGTDLLLVVSARITGTIATYQSFTLGLNGSSTSFSQRYLRGNGASVATNSSSTSSVEATVNGGLSTTSTFSNVSVYIPNYAGATNKSFSADAVIESNNASSYVFQTLSAGLWSNTAAITSIVLGSSINFAQYSTASLYTITKGSGGATVS